MIESSAIDSPRQGTSFPKLMVSSINSLIVLMTSESKGCGEGTLVMADSTLWSIGYFTNTWVMEHFTNYNGSVTLTNK